MSTTVANVSTTIVVMKTTGEKLRAIRELAHESQDDAARVAHVQKQAISKIERDMVAEPGARTMYRLARHYGVGLGWLLGINDSHDVSLESETLRLAASRITNTVGALKRHYESTGQGELDLTTERDAERFLLAYKALTELPPEPTADNLIAFGSKLEAMAPRSGGDGRNNSLSVGGKAGRNVAGGRPGKKA